MEEAKAEGETIQCGVCGDLASGRHYNAVTCQACREFFRKNALIIKELKCRFGNNCKENAVLFKRCQKCRLEQCFEIGMKKPWFKPEGENKADREIIEKFRKSRTNPQIASELQESISNPYQTQDLERPVKQQQLYKLLVSDTNLCLLSTSSVVEGLPKSVYDGANEIELPIRNSRVKHGEINYLQRQKLEELIVAHEEFKMPLDCNVNDPSLSDFINMIEHAVRCLIKMSKKIKGFKNLCHDDQTALLKGGCTELMILRSVMSYDPEKGCWEHIIKQGPKMSIKVDILKEARARRNAYEEHKRFVTSFHSQCRIDENIMLILRGIVLFTPERTNIVNKLEIQIEQDSYYCLLKSYLCSVYSWCEAESIYRKLTNKIRELQILIENHIRVYLDANPNDVLPYLIEILDLKH